MTWLDEKATEIWKAANPEWRNDERDTDRVVQEEAKRLALEFAERALYECLDRWGGEYARIEGHDKIVSEVLAATENGNE